MTDNCSELRDALRMTWPSTLLLCVFHLLQQICRWLHDSKNKVEIIIIDIIQKNGLCK